MALHLRHKFGDELLIRIRFQRGKIGGGNFLQKVSPATPFKNSHLLPPCRLRRQGLCSIFGSVPANSPGADVTPCQYNEVSCVGVWRAALSPKKGVSRSLLRKRIGMKPLPMGAPPVPRHGTVPFLAVDPHEDWERSERMIVGSLPAQTYVTNRFDSVWSRTTKGSPV